MRGINSKENMMREKSISVFEILLLVISIAAFAYFIGDEFEFVSAVDAGGGEGTGSVGSSIVTLYSSSKGVNPGFPGATAKAVAATAGIPTGVGAGMPPGLGSVGSANIYGGTGAGIHESILETGRRAGEIGGAGGSETAAGKLSRLWGKVNPVLKKVMRDAGIAYVLYLGIAKGLAAIFPDVDPDIFETLGRAAGWGYFGGSTVATLIPVIWPSTQGAAILGGFSIVGPLSISWLGLIGIGVGGLIWLFTYKQDYTSVVTYTCFPWQPVTGGENCRQCNTGEFPCTKYKCESLGQSCELLNAGTKEEVCEWVNRNDVSAPKIEAWKGTLTEGYSYVPDNARLPPDRGVVIKNTQSADGCVPSFSRISYGVAIDEPAKCKVDTVRTDTFNNMKWFLSNGYYKYNHSITSVVAGAAELESEGIEVEVGSGGKYETFVRCEDKNGNTNTGSFVFKYCVQDTPDITAPLIQVTNPINGMPIQSGRTSQLMEVYVDKPSTCKWGHSDEDYDTMPNSMQCSSSITEMNANMLYKCTTTLDGLKDSTSNKFYFRCKSYPMKNETDRYKNEESYAYTLIGTKPLVIDSIKPESGTVIKDSTQTVKVTLEATTSAGYKSGEAKCYFKQKTETDASYVLFFSTNSYYSSQDLWLTKGLYRYVIKCCDLGGNCASQETEFEVDTDFVPAIIVRAYNEGNNLKIVTEESAECVYDTTSCSYTFDDGIKMQSSDGLAHTTEWDTDTNFYIKCRDEYGNEPVADSCSMIVRPFNLY